jgi:hypothetical protein
MEKKHKNKQNPWQVKFTLNFPPSLSFAEACKTLTTPKLGQV